MKIRQAGPDDLDIVSGITQRAYTPYVAELGGKPMPLVTDYAERVAAGDVWLLDEEDVPVAMIVLEDNDDHVHIFSIAVEPSAQSSGFGRRLLAFAEEFARKSGHDHLTLVTNARMERNIGIYKRAGYSETARRPHPVHAGWVVVHMEKRLATSAVSRRTA